MLTCWMTIPETLFTGVVWALNFVQNAMIVVEHGTGIEYMPRIQPGNGQENTYDNEDGLRRIRYVTYAK